MLMRYLKRISAFLIAVLIFASVVPVSGVDAFENDVSMGIDVSSWNKTIDWQLVSTQIDFAILRVSFRMTKDKYFEQNAAGCEANEIPYGVYHYFSALTVEQAKSEAELVIEALEGYSLAFPVFLNVDGTLLDSLSPEQLQELVLIFCNTVAEAGYQPGLYSYADLLAEHFGNESFSSLPKWVSQVDVDECTYSGDFVMWQYTWRGCVEGISGDVDCNYYYPSCDHAAAEYAYENNTHVFRCLSCSHKWTKPSIDNKEFAFNTAAPALSVDIVMNIATTIPAGFSDPYMVVEFNGTTTTLTDYTINETNGRYVFAFPGINPQTMGDTFHATVYADVGGYEVSVDLEYSMLKYLDSQLKKLTEASTLRTALSDLIMYGDANQVYEGYKTDALLSTLLSDAAKANLDPSTFPGLDESYNKQVTAGVKDANIDLKGVTMALGSKIMVRMTVFCADAAAYTVKVTINGESFLYPVSELALADGYTDRYVVEFDQIRATQFGEEITFSFLDADGNQVGRTLTYTVYTYVQKNQAADNENLVNLLKAIYNYGESVKNI